MTEQQTYWQHEDKSIIGRVLLMVGVFAVVMTIVATGISIVL